MNVSNLDFPTEPIRALCEEYHVRELALFGSARTERFRPDSDIDLLVPIRTGRSYRFPGICGIAAPVCPRSWDAGLTWCPKMV